MSDEPPPGFPPPDAADEVWFRYFESWTSAGDYDTYMKHSADQGPLLRYIESKGGRAWLARPFALWSRQPFSTPERPLNEYLPFTHIDIPDGRFEVMAVMTTGFSVAVERTVLVIGDGRYVVAVTIGETPRSWRDGEYFPIDEADSLRQARWAFVRRCESELAYHDAHRRPPEPPAKAGYFW